jgi:hypothetical protein
MASGARPVEDSKPRLPLFFQDNQYFKAVPFESSWVWKRCTHE